MGSLYGGDNLMLATEYRKVGPHLTISKAIIILHLFWERRGSVQECLT